MNECGISIQTHTPLVEIKLASILASIQIEGGSVDTSLRQTQTLWLSSPGMHSQELLLFQVV